VEAQVKQFVFLVQRGAAMLIWLFLTCAAAAWDDLPPSEVWVVAFREDYVVPGRMNLALCYTPGCNDVHDWRVALRVFQTRAELCHFLEGKECVGDNSNVFMDLGRGERLSDPKHFLALYRGGRVQNVTYASVGVHEVERQRVVKTRTVEPDMRFVF
jgi:hypothetical protein